MNRVELTRNELVRCTVHCMPPRRIRLVRRIREGAERDWPCATREDYRKVWIFQLIDAHSGRFRGEIVLEYTTFLSEQKLGFVTYHSVVKPLAVFE